jgi:hypothetical protein
MVRRFCWFIESALPEMKMYPTSVQACAPIAQG